MTTPRRMRHYAARTGYVLGLFLLMYTGWLVLAGVQEVRNLGDLARFAARIFEILAQLQLALLSSFAALSAASAVALEKDRKTLLLLLLTRLTNFELVAGKLAASLLHALVMLLAALPVFVFLSMLGGVSLSQILRVYLVTLASALAAASLGSLIAFWREKTFQSLALTLLLLVGWTAGGELVGRGLFGARIGGFPAETVASFLSPWRAIQDAARPVAIADPLLGPFQSTSIVFLLAALAGAVLLVVIAVARVRVWNPSREATAQTSDIDTIRQSIWGAEHDLQETAGAHGPAAGEASRESPAGRTVAELATAAIARRNQARAQIDRGDAPVSRGRVRHVWDNPILWREIRTWCYGRKVLAIRFAYVLFIAVTLLAMHRMIGSSRMNEALQTQLAVVVTPMFVLSLILINAQAVTSITGERDAKAIDLLLVTDLTPSEIIYGKLGGIFYNVKEMVVLPWLLCGYLAFQGVVGLESFCFLVVGLTVMSLFAAMLGIHSGLAYFNSRQAIGVSLGTMFFLFLGVATCMKIMDAFGGSFEVQFFPFAALAFGGSLGMFLALGSRNPSPAISLASISCPLATFFIITGYFLKLPMQMFLVTVLTYGFATAAMLVPALFEFDVAMGRTTTAEE